MTASVIAVVQARLGSRRLPSKVLADVCGYPLLKLLLERLRGADRLEDVVVAVPDQPTDDLLAASVASWGYGVIRGDSDDVLSRYLRAVEEFAPDVVVRVTGDCPLIDPRLVDQTVETLVMDAALDYVAIGRSYPDGMDCEAVRASALRRAAAETDLPSDREHVTKYLWTHPDRFGVRFLERIPSLARVRMTVDESADLLLVRQLVSRLGGGASYEEYVEELLKEPELMSMNAQITRDEGLWRSENRDRLDKIGMRHGRERSEHWLERSRRVIPGATQTLSKGSDQFVLGVAPVFLESGSGCHVTDVDGNVFIDYPMALGPVILGYGHPRTVQAVKSQVERGTTFTLPHPLEVEVAELLVEMVPCAEMVRFGKNGSDATTAAVRVARAATGRDVVIDCGYHGWHDWHIVHTPRNAGIPATTRDLIDSFQFNDLGSLREALSRHDGNVAAIILEIGLDDPNPGFLSQVREEAHRAGAILIFDEIVTGFRLAKGGAQDLYGVVPDLACFGKAMANGLPLSAVVGRSEIMSIFDRVFFSGTFGGEVLSLAAAKATLYEIKNSPVLDHIWTQGERLRSGLQHLVKESGLAIEVLGQPPRGGLVFNQTDCDNAELRGLFLQETVRRGVLFGGPIFTTYAHEAEDIDRTLAVCQEALSVMSAAVATGSVRQKLDGEPPSVVFRPLRNASEQDLR